MRFRDNNDRNPGTALRRVLHQSNQGRTHDGTMGGTQIAELDQVSTIHLAGR